MLKRLYTTPLVRSTFLFIFILLVSSAFAQESADLRKAIDSYIEMANQLHDTTSVRRLFLRKNGDNKELRTVENVLLANSYAKTLDRKNAISDHLYKSTVDVPENALKDGTHIWALVEYGFYLYTYRKPNEAMPFMVEAIHLIEQNPEIWIPNTAETLKKIGYFLTTLGDQNRAIQFLKIAEKHAKPGTTQLGDILNSIGRCYFILKQNPTAHHYYLRAMSTAQQSNDHVRQAKIWGDLATTYQQQNKNEEAEKAWLKDIELSKKYNSIQNTMFASTQLAKFWIESEKWDQAASMLTEALTIARSKAYFKKNEYEITKLQIIVAQHKNNFNEELVARRKLDTLELEMASLDGDNVLQNLNLETQKEMIRLSLEAEREARSKELIIRNGLLLIGILILLILVFFVLATRRKHKILLSSYENNIMKLQLEKVTSENKLNQANKTLSSYRDYLFEKNQQINELQAEIKNFDKSSSIITESHKAKLEELLESHLLSEDSWQTFKTVFTQEEPEFFQNIIDNFSDLTESNLRIIFLQRMGFNNPKTAQILGITIDAVKKNKQRMRKKYGYAYTQYIDSDKVREDELD